MPFRPRLQSLARAVKTFRQGTPVTSTLIARGRVWLKRSGVGRLIRRRLDPQRLIVFLVPHFSIHSLRAVCGSKDHC